jgi:lambda family phage portal protein
MHILNKYEEAELVASRVAAAKMGFFTKEKGTAAGFGADDTDDDGNTITEAAPGTFQELPAGMDFKPFDPEHPTANFDAFCKGVLRGVATGLGVSYSGLTGDLTNANYSSLRAGLLPERDLWRALQGWVIEHFCQIVFADWLWMALLSGAIDLPVAKYEKFLAAEFQPRGWAWVDPESDANASEKAIAAGLNTYTHVLAEQGRDFEDTVAQLAEERKVLAAAGIPLLDPKTAAAPKPVEKDQKKDLLAVNTTVNLPHQKTVNKSGRAVRNADGSLSIEMVEETAP